MNPSITLLGSAGKCGPGMVAIAYKNGSSEGEMGSHGVRALLMLGILGILAFWVSRPSTSLADDDPSANIVGSWRATRRTANSGAVRHNLFSFLPGGSVIEAGNSVYASGAPFGNGTFLETPFVGTWIS